MKKKIFIGLGIITFAVCVFAANFDIGNRTSVELLSYPIQAGGTHVTNLPIDTRDYVGTLSVIQCTGFQTGTNVGTLMTSTGSVASGTWSTVTNFAAVTGTNTQALPIDTRAINRYLRYHTTFTGTLSTSTVSVISVGVKQTY